MIDYMVILFNEMSQEEELFLKFYKVIAYLEDFKHVLEELRVHYKVIFAAFLKSVLSQIIA